MFDELDLSRNVVNHRINRIKRFMRWAVSEETRHRMPTRHSALFQARCTGARTLAKPRP